MTHVTAKAGVSEKRSGETFKGDSTCTWHEPTRDTGSATLEPPTKVLMTPGPTITAAGKRKLSPTSVLLGNRPARRPVSELQASRTASVYGLGIDAGRART